jgi:transcription termination factor NusB
MVEFLNIIGHDKVFQYITDMLEDEIEQTEENIQDELDFAKENPPGSAYASQGVEAKKAVKYLRGVKKQKQQLTKLFQQFLNLKTKVDKL